MRSDNAAIRARDGVMKGAVLIVSILLLLVSISQIVSADVFNLYMAVPKAIYGPGEMIEIYGGLFNITNGSGTASFSGIPNASVALSIINNSGSVVSNYTLNTTASGMFYSQGNYYNGTNITVPSTTGNYTVTAEYNASGALYYASSTIVVVSSRVDEIRVRTGEPVYYPGSEMEIVAEAVMISGENRLPAANITINGTVRNSAETVLSSFNCITDSNGKCTISGTASSSAGTYIVEANNYIGYTTFRVVPFEVDVYIKDGYGISLKQTFSPGQEGYVEVRASYNGTNPSGDFTVSGNIYDSSGSIVSSISSFALDPDNSYVNKAKFTVASGAAGTYTARVAVAKTGDGTVNGSAIYQVKQWELSISKTSTNNGFENGYTAFPNSTVYFKADVVDLANGTGITGLENNYTIRLKNYMGAEVSNATAAYNSTLDDYLFNLTMPSTIGAYTLSVSVAYSGETQTVTRAITVTDKSASVTPTDADGKKKEVFTTSEFVYLKVIAKNATSDTNITDAEIVAVKYEDGTQINYNSTENCGAMNVTDTNLQWCWDSNRTLVKLDPPNKGGMFSAEVYANTRNISAAGTFMVKPYSVCVSAKASESLSGASDYYWQFKTTDTIYFLVTVVQTQDTSSITANSTQNVMGSAGRYYGSGQACSISNTESAVNNATLSINKVVNVQSGKTESLNSTTSICKATTLSSGKAAYICTLQPQDGKWDGGGYYTVLDITGPDGTTKDKGYGMFEARSFYLYGWSSSWQNKPASNINFTISMYSGGSSWWSSSAGGLSGTVKLEKIRYLGSSWGEWNSPVDYDYDMQNMGSVTISSGSGVLTLNASRAPGGQWRSGMYSAVIKGTDSGSGDVDYGELWFEVRNWYAWAQPVEVTSWPYQSKWQINTRENATLYVKISNAGDMWSTSGQSLGGNVTIRVKKIEYYTAWPPKELPASNYTATSITVNASNCDVWSYSCSDIDTSKYLINISPTSGRWQSGYYSVLLDLNGTETGYGSFNALAFYVSTQPVDINGTSAYASRGNGPVYINVTTTKSQSYYSYWYSSSDYINTTFVDLVLHRWDNTGATWRQVDLNYPEDINVSIVNRSGMNITGSATLNITHNGSGSWPSGYYYGELTVMNNESDTGTGWIWFSIEPFRVDLQSSQYEIAQDDNVNATLNIYEPGWSLSTPLPGNYSIVSAIERTWSYGGETVIVLNVTPSTFNGSNTTLTLIKPDSGWTNGYKSVTVTVKDINTNATKEGWLSFRVVPFRIAVERLSESPTGITNNVTIRVNLTNPKTGVAASGNLSSVYKWGWPSKTYYNFTVEGGCSSVSFGSCTINGAKNVTIIPPAAGWDDGYNSFQFTFTGASDATPVDDWSSIWFDARQAISGWMEAVDSGGMYLWAASNTSNITMHLYSLQNMNGNSIAVNVTGVQYYYQSGGMWVDENSRTYSTLPSSKWSVVNITTGQPTGSNETGIGSGYIRLAPPSGDTWANGEYYIKIFVSSGSDSGIIKNGYFRIKDMTPITITVNSPANDTVTNASYIIFNATTSKRGTCSININNNGGSYYYAYLSQYYSYNSAGGSSYGGNGTNSTSVVTGDTTHIFNHSTSGMPAQNYTAWFYCNDYDWNYASTAVNFVFNGTSSGGNQSNQTNATSVQILNVTLTPTNPTTNSTLRCNTTATASNATIYINVTWYRNDSSIAGIYYVPYIQNNTSTNISSVPPANLSAGDVWKCSVRATTDMINWTNYTNSSAVTINASLGSQSAPWFTVADKNSTLAGNSTLFYTHWYDSVNLSGYIFSFDNGGGAFTNDSWVQFSGTDNWSNVTKTLNLTVNTTIRWLVYANNSNNLWNATGVLTFNTMV